MPAKKVVQDIVPGEKRSIRNVPVRRPKINEKLVKEIEEEEVVIEKPKKTRPLNVETRMADSATRPPRKTRSKPKSPWKVILYLGLVIVCVGLIGVALSLLYTKGIVRVTPIVQNLNVDGTITVKKDATAEQLRYEVITVNDDATKTVIATDGPLVQTKAKGTATLFNATQAAQKLIAGTRLSNPDGLIYRTTTTVTIPAKKTSPGNISVGIVADAAGTNYNARLTDLAGDFKIVAYKGTDKYATVYARLKTDITGGFSGTKKIISAEAQKAAETELQAELKSKLLAQIHPIVPKGYVLFDAAYTIEYKESDPAPAASGTADISMHGTMNGIIFNSTKLLETVAMKELRTFPTQTYSVSGLSDLKFAISNSRDFSIAKGTPLTFTLKGPVILTGTFSEEKLKNDLKGVSLKDSNAVFRTYSAISNAYAVITPFWMRSFPKSVDHITIEYKSQ